MIDEDGFRSNIGIILINENDELFWAKRIGQDAWQFPQGGINPEEDLFEALYRELQEEVGLTRDDVKVVTYLKQWIRYRLPKRLIRKNSYPVCVGQKQKWFLLQFIGDESKINLNSSHKPEFDSWRWVSYWYPLRYIVPFKREVYRKALTEFAMHKYGKKIILDPIDQEI